MSGIPWPLARHGGTCMKQAEDVPGSPCAWAIELQG
jgi:hypothetical protein